MPLIIELNEFTISLPSGVYKLIISGDNYLIKQERIIIPEVIKQENISFITRLNLKAVAVTTGNYPEKELFLLLITLIHAEY